jgi:septal ring factor EnvC (AmiA/AmiB activator)
MIARCPLCERRVFLSDGGELSRHYPSTWAVAFCEGSNKTPDEIAIELADGHVAAVRNRETSLNERIERAKADLARAESELAALPAEIKKAEKKLATLRKKLAAKGGAS